jgi:hypothetical protein
MEIVWIYNGFSGAIANLIVWISPFFSSELEDHHKNTIHLVHSNVIMSRRLPF